VLIPGLPLFRIMVLSQSLNAILLPVLLILVLILANDHQLMGKWKNGTVANVLSIGMTVLIFIVTVVLFAGELL
jgi:Mn2+/Fe2+ NRAMP family transporter